MLGNMVPYIAYLGGACHGVEVLKLVEDGSLGTLRDGNLLCCVGTWCIERR